MICLTNLRLKIFLGKVSPLRFPTCDCWGRLRDFWVGMAPARLRSEVIARGAPRTTAGPWPFLEACCEEDSAFGRLCEERGRPCLRITKEVGSHRAAGVQAALNFLDDNPGADVWAALPCTPWMSWSHVNDARLGPKFRAHLAWRQRQSLRMVKSATLCIQAARSTGGHGHFEWPRRARGWKRRAVLRMLSLLGMQLAFFDGCSFGVRASASLLARKPWTAATTHPGLAAVLRRYQCTGDHLHGALSGAWATRSGRYPDALCNVALDALDVRPMQPRARPRRHGLRAYSRHTLLRAASALKD